MIRSHLGYTAFQISPAIVLVEAYDFILRLQRISLRCNTALQKLFRPVNVVIGIVIEYKLPSLWALYDVVGMPSVCISASSTYLFVSDEVLLCC